jgi:hypothetical protein
MNVRSSANGSTTKFLDEQEAARGFFSVAMMICVPGGSAL